MPSLTPKRVSFELQFPHFNIPKTAPRSRLAMISVAYPAEDSRIGTEILVILSSDSAFSSQPIGLYSRRSWTSGGGSPGQRGSAKMLWHPQSRHRFIRHFPGDRSTVIPMCSQSWERELLLMLPRGWKTWVTKYHRGRRPLRIKPSPSTVPGETGVGREESGQPAWNLSCCSSTPKLSAG